MKSDINAAKSYDGITDYDISTLIENIQRIMKERNITQEELAAAAGIAQPRISKIFKREGSNCFTIQQLVAIASYFHVSVDSLLGIKTNNPPEEEKEKYEFLIGIGKSVKGYHDLKDSFEDSKTAIEYIDVIRKITCDIQKSVVDCSKLGFFHIFANIKDEKQLRIYIPDAVNEIHQYDIKKNGELIDTLECYLNHKQSIRKASELMGVHSRTVSYRLQKIVKLTGLDFDNIAEMLAVRNGIIILKILELL